MTAMPFRTKLPPLDTSKATPGRRYALRERLRAHKLFCTAVKVRTFAQIVHDMPLRELLRSYGRNRDDDAI